LGGADSFTAGHPRGTPASFVPPAKSLIVRPDDFLSPTERMGYDKLPIYPGDATRTALAADVAKENPAGPTRVVPWGTDPIQHWFWKYHDPAHWIGPPIPPEEKKRIGGDPVADYYRDTDELIGRILALLRESDTVLVVSDHGAGPVTQYDPNKSA